MASSAEPPDFASRLRRTTQFLRPSHQHSALSATLLLMSAIMLSRVIGYLREAYIAWAFGAGHATDAYVAAFTLPDWLNYMVAGGAASITFISIFTRYTAEGREEEANRAFSIVITLMTAVLTAGIVLAEIFCPQIERVMFPKFSPEELKLCVYLTRILLPAQLFFYVGGVVSAVLLSRRMFLFPALGPLFYNLFIILGGVTLSWKLGIASLAIGAVAGGFVGPFLINAIGAGRAGMRYRPAFDFRHPAFLEWVRLSIPLMLGVTLVAADEWILRYFASGGTGDITRLNYAKRLFAVPIAVLGQATGQASLPFFARLFGEKRLQEFASTVSNAVYRVSAASFLAAAWMAAAALPIVDLVYRRGRFQFADSQATAVFFFWFALSLALWSAQGLYARGFYAAGDTLTPMVAGTIITLASLPVYSWFFRTFEVTGLAVASDIGILANTVALAWLLHRKRLAPFSVMKWGELGKALLTAIFAGLAAYGVTRSIVLNGSRGADLKALGLVTLTWAAAVAVGLMVTRSELPGQLRRRLAATPPEPPPESRETRELFRP
ncbi:MAG TPA: murein biosynthesis integral membrane protein MurJ [Terriglobales bacterium]|jgi:putative peptidoglycan lipid II flippase|nr:murein biosynthesis integral membrane protein MurJ [Terriglobales bacterium]